MPLRQTLFKLLGPVGRWLVQRRLRSTLGIDIRRIRIERNLVYGRGGDTELTLDLAMPCEGNGPFPAVVLVPGGAWQYFAQPLLMEGMLELLASRGYATAEVHYRLAPAHKFPVQVEDCKAAVRWMRANAERYGFDPDHIAAVGPSSGGHLACMLGLTVPADGFDGQSGNPGHSSQVQAVVNLFGIADLTDYPWRAQKEKGLLLPFLGATFAAAPDLYRKASPIEYIRPGVPPFLIIHGDADQSVPVGQSQRLAERLAAVGGTAQLIVVPGAGHGWGPPLLLQTIEQVGMFLDSCLKHQLPAHGRA
jgi:acetyl esterase/lipase